MTDTYSTPLTDDILDDETESARLSREADALLAEGEARAFGGTTSVREAVREDLADGRQWARERGQRVQETIRDQPIATAVYAVGLGVIIGLLLRR